MKKLILLSVAVFTLSIVSCEKGHLKDLDNPQFEQIDNENINAEKDPNEPEDTKGGIWTGSIRIPSHG